MSDFVVTLKGRVLSDWYDRNNHMNVVHYLSLFDQATFKFVEKVGITEDFVAKEGITLVAGRILTSHKKEMFVDEEFEIHSALVNYNESYFTVTHRMKRKGVLVASCDLRMDAIDMKTRSRAKIPVTVLEQCPVFHVSGLKDFLAEMI